MSTMRAIQFSTFGGPDVLHMTEVIRPSPGEGEVLIKVIAAGVNPHDLFNRSGALKLITGKKFPHGTGLEFAGEIVSGAKSIYAPGDRVWGSVPAMKPHSTGAMAEYVVVDTDRIAPLPPLLTPEEGASLVVSATTAYRALYREAGLKRGDKVLIRGAGGGVGLSAVQIAVAAGAEVTTLSSQKDRDALEQLGARHTLNYRTTMANQLGCFDVIFDTVGTEILSFRRHLVPGGRMVTIAFTSAAAFAAIGVSTVFGARRIRAFSSDAKRELLDTITPLVNEGQLRPIIAATFALADIAHAHADLEAGGKRGKRVVSI